MNSQEAGRLRQIADAEMEKVLAARESVKRAQQDLEAAQKAALDAERDAVRAEMRNQVGKA
ncbi:hypothetical protein FPZ24_08050 [Sphingomonas panacisoli]|uniref:Uncharacterized protein n=1 Tax=Sphingomonas panacisoli TaxID=1813879 RepID=A0A5B8LHX6_9SPHN|nr:hypothetical protein [Sphingomonas panacisoli]QDZ07435.1 hypothetical protein FPZ24_08050 [Sphingomonas panacisoli]